MTLAELTATTPLDRWRSLSADQREAIGAKLLEHVFADLVADDDGFETTEAERNAARVVADDAFGNLFHIVEAAFPAVCWAYPEGTVYVARDASGTHLGCIEHTEGETYIFVPAAPRRRRHRGPKYGLPLDCLPAWARRLVDAGGWCGAVIPSLPTS